MALAAWPLALIGATCGQAVEVASLVASDWLAVTCENNPQSYCDSARVLTLSLAARLREERTLSLQGGPRPLTALVDPSQLPQRQRPPEPDPGFQAESSLEPDAPEAAAVVPAGQDPPQEEDLFVATAPPSQEAFEAPSDQDESEVSTRGGVTGIDVAVFDESGREVDDGAAVRGGDPVRIAFRPFGRSFVYVFFVDAVGTVTALFPPIGAAEGNPVAPDRTVVVSEPAAGLERHADHGIVHVYVALSDAPRDDLEKARGAFVMRPRSALANPMGVDEPTVIGQSQVRAREVPPALPIGSGIEVTPRRHRAEGVRQDLVITRWFRRQ